MIGTGFRRPRKCYSTSTTTADYDEPTDSWIFSGEYDICTDVTYDIPAPLETPEEEPKKPIQKNRITFLNPDQRVSRDIFKPGPGWGFFKGCFS